MWAAFELFKAFNRQDAVDNRKFAEHNLPIPVLTIAGDKSMYNIFGEQANLVAVNVNSIVLKDTGHWLFEERPAEVKLALKEFFAK